VISRPAILTRPSRNKKREYRISNKEFRTVEGKRKKGKIIHFDILRFLVLWNRMGTDP